MSPEIIPLGLGLSNAYLIKNAHGNFLIDCGAATQRDKLDGLLAAAGVKPGNLQMLILTHADLDHSGNTAYLQNKYLAKVAVHPQEVVAVETGDMFKTRCQMNPIIKSLGNLFLFFLRLPRLELFKPDILLDDGFDLNPYGLDASVIHIPGHSTGSVGILTAGGSFFCGDLVMEGKGKLKAMVDNREDHRRSLDKIISLPFTEIYPGHGNKFNKELLEASRSGF